MGSSQSLQIVSTPDQLSQMITQNEKASPRLSITKKKLPPLLQINHYQHQSTSKSTEEKQFQINHSHTSENSLKDTPLKSDGQNSKDSGNEVFNWKHDINNSMNQASLLSMTKSQLSNISQQRNLQEPLVNIKRFSYEVSQEFQGIASPMFNIPQLGLREINSVASVQNKEPNKKFKNLDILKLNYQQIHKKKELVKLAFVGTHPAVGKTTLIKSFIQQSIDFDSFDTKQTLGCDFSFFNYELDDTLQINLQLWEFESNDQSLDKWKNQINRAFDAIILVFDEFNQDCEDKIIKRLQILYQISTSQNPNKIVPIMMAGNDRLNMKITGKELDIQNAVQRLCQGNQIQVRIIDPKQIKETNNLFKNIILNIMQLQKKLY